MRILVGKVLCKKMLKTAIVLVKKLKKHTKYKKYIVKKKKYYVHDDFDLCEQDNIVWIIHCNPISKKKFWKVLRFLK